MKEYPILFSTEMIKAILEGRKTQTRRVMKQKDITLAGLRGIVNGTQPAFGPCPYGGVGDRLWVKRTRFTMKADTLCWLEITGVRVERLQEITEEDAKQEGIIFVEEETPAYSSNWHPCAIKNFALLWDSLNTKRGYPWDTNPWVWCIEFRRLT